MTTYVAPCTWLLLRFFEFYSHLAAAPRFRRWHSVEFSFSYFKKKNLIFNVWGPFLKDKEILKNSRELIMVQKCSLLSLKLHLKGHANLTIIGKKSYKSMSREISPLCCRQFHITFSSSYHHFKCWKHPFWLIHNMYLFF